MLQRNNARSSLLVFTRQTADSLLKDVSEEVFDAVVLPGGLPGAVVFVGVCPVGTLA